MSDHSRSQGKIDSGLLPILQLYADREHLPDYEYRRRISEMDPLGDMRKACIRRGWLEDGPVMRLTWDGTQVLKAEPVVDESSMRPISQFVDNERFKDISAVKRFLEQHPEITTRKTSAQRMDVHAGQFLAAVQEEKDRDCQAGKAQSRRMESHIQREAQQQEDRRRREAK
jgi:hypothetical protein